MRVLLLKVPLGTGPILGQTRSWDMPSPGTSPLVGQVRSWDPPYLGTHPPLGHVRSSRCIHIGVIFIDDVAFDFLVVGCIVTY